MASIQDIANAANRIGESSKVVQARSQGCADTLRTECAKLNALVTGSTTGTQAVQQVNQAERAVRDTALQLAKLQSTITTFINDLKK